MNVPVSTEGEAGQVALKQNWASSFRRTQWMLGLWGLIMIVGGILHNNFASSRAWGVGVMLLVWLGLVVAGVVGTYLLTPEMMPSGMLFLWVGVMVLAFGLTLVLVYPLSSTGVPVSVVWHLAFALGYLGTGYYMDRRLWWLAGWEVLVALVMIGLGLANNPATTTPAPTPGGPTTPAAPDSDYTYNILTINARLVLMQVVEIAGFQPLRNQGLLLGLTSGIPMLLAALPFWEERYGRS